jgi:hypothetical protein
MITIEQTLTIPDDTPPTPNDIDEFYGCFKGKGIWEGDSVELIRKIRDEWTD